MSKPSTASKWTWRRVLILPAIALIYLYKGLVSPIIHMVAPGSGCRYLPTCSSYALEALQTHGLFKGSWLACKRIATCHPWGGYGYDPVPEKKEPCCSKNSLNISSQIHG